jgi:hypothetical protein
MPAIARFGSSPSWRQSAEVRRSDLIVFPRASRQRNSTATA